MPSLVFAIRMDSGFQLPPSVAEIIASREQLVNVNSQRNEELTKLDRVALAITDRVGTMGFFLTIFTWTVFWLLWNFLAPQHLKFDPPMGFVFYLFISNVIQILLMPLLMVGQNLQGKHSELRAENDFNVNVKAEKEVEAILRHLEHQNALLYALMEKVGLNVEEALRAANPSQPTND